MATELTMPKNDMDMEEGTIVKWLKNVGDKVEKGEMFMEIETDKTSMEIESPATGVLLAQFYQGGSGNSGSRCVTRRLRRVGRIIIPQGNCIFRLYASHD